MYTLAFWLFILAGNLLGIYTVIGLPGVGNFMLFCLFSFNILLAGSRLVTLTGYIIDFYRRIGRL